MGTDFFFALTSPFANPILRVPKLICLSVARDIHPFFNEKFFPNPFTLITKKNYFFIFKGLRSNP
jgi:hypothetical protein